MQSLLPERLRMARMERGLSLRKAAKLTGVTKETLSELERGLRSPHPPTLFKIAQGYGLRVQDLLEPTVPKAPAPNKSGPFSGYDIAEIRRLIEEHRAPANLDEAIDAFKIGMEELRRLRDSETAVPASVEVVAQILKDPADIAEDLEPWQLWHAIFELSWLVSRTKDDPHKAIFVGMLGVAMSAYYTKERESASGYTMGPDATLEYIEDAIVSSGPPLPPEIRDVVSALEEVGVSEEETSRVVELLRGRHEP